MPKPALTAIELVALAGAVKPAELKTARAAIPEDSLTPVDFKVRISGSVNRHRGTPSATTSAEVTATPNFCTPLIVAEMLRRLGPKAERIRETLRDIAAELQANPQLTPDAKRDAIAAIFADVANTYATTKTERRTIAAVVGAIYSDLTVERR